MKSFFSSIASSILKPLGNDQKIHELTAEDHERLKQQRSVIERYLGDENSLKNYATAAGKLGTLRALLNNKVFRPDQTYELQCMGIVLGDTFVLDMGFHWIMIEDSHGRDPAIRLRETSIILYPLTMISKRIEEGKEVDVFQLYNGLAEVVAKQDRTHNTNNSY